MTGSFTKAQITYTLTDTDISKFRKLNVRPYFSFYIPQSSQVRGLPINFNIDAQYWLPSSLNVRAGLCLGTFKGGTAGITYELKNRSKITKNKYVLSRTKSGNIETTNYFKAPTTSKVIFGPCLDFTAGALAKAGFYGEVTIGLNWQKYTRAYATLNNGRYIRSSANGWIDVKLQVVVRSVNWGSPVINEIPYRGLGVGGQVNISAVARPWKGVSFYAGLPMGVVKMIGAKADKIQPILNINLGASINLF